MANVTLNDDTWTYGGEPATVPRDHVRELIGDTDISHKLMLDATIAHALTERKNEYFAAAKLCSELALRFARKVSISHEGASEQWGELVENYRNLADDYEKQGQALAESVGTAGAPQAAALTKSALKDINSDTDRRLPVFMLGNLYDPLFDPRN